MSDLSKDASASSSSAQQESSSGNTTPKGYAPQSNISNLAGETVFAGSIVPGSYSSPNCALKDERVKIILDDGRVVGSTGQAARNLKEMIGYWQEYLKLTVTMYGTTNIIKEVKLRI